MYPFPFHKKCRTTSGQTALSLPFKLPPRYCQRIGFAVQKIVLAWDIFASYLGFKDVEHMLSPYMYISGTYATWVVLQSGSGFVPATPTSAVFDPDPTFNPEETFPGVVDRSTEVDANLRYLADLFLGDIRGIVSRNDLYCESDNKIPFFRHLKEGVDPLPPRFRSIDSELVTRVKNEVTATASRSQPSQMDVDVVDDNDEITPVLPESAPSSARLPSRPSSFSPPPPSQPELDQNMNLIREEMEPYVQMVHSSFTGFEDVYENDFFRQPTILGAAQLVLTDPPYNIRKDRGCANSEYDSLATDEMKEVVHIISNLLRPGGHAIVFCSIKQFSIWHDLFASVKQRPDMRKPTPVFSVDKVPLTIAKHQSVNSSFPGTISCSLRSTCEFAVHLKKNGLSFSEEEQMVDYRHHNYVASTYAATRNIINNVRWLLPGEQLRVPKRDGTGTEALRTEQKPLGLLRELISRFSKPRDLVVDLFGGTFSTAVACFTIPQHRRFAGCEPDESCFKVAEENTVFRFATAIFDKSSDITLSDDFATAAALVRRGKKANLNGDHRWSAPKGFPLYQKLPPHIISALASSWNDSKVMVKLLNRPVHLWTREHQGLLQQADTNLLRVVDATNCGVYTAKSSIRHTEAGLGCFASRSFNPDEVIGAYYGTIVYHDLGKRKEKYKTYGDGIMGVTPDRFRRTAMQIDVRTTSFPQVRELLNGRKAICVVPAPFAATAFVNDYRYHEDDEDYQAWKNNELSFVRRPNVKFLLSKSDIIRSDDLQEYNLLQLRACELINHGEELFADYQKSDFIHKE